MTPHVPSPASGEPLPPFRPLLPEQMAMLELSPNPKLVLDRQFRIRFVNQAVATYARIDRTTLIGRNVWDCYPELRHSIFHQAYQRVLDTGDPARFERYDAESDRWQSVYAFPADDGVIAVLEDVTEQRRNVERLRQSEEVLRLAQAAANVGSFQRDLRTGETSWSEQLVRINGFDPAAFDATRIGRDPALDLVIHVDRDLARSAWQALLSTGATQHLRLRIRRPDGTLRYLQNSMLLVRDADGQPARVVGTALDVTDQVEADLERQRIESRMQQAQKLESLGVLAGGIAHDFNNLLVGILGNASLARLEVEAHHAAHECLQEIESAAQRAAELTRQLLAYAGKGRYLIEAADASRSIDDMASLLRSAIARTASLTFTLEPGLPPIDVDADQFRQVVMTLVTNASDALQGGPGDVQVSTGYRELNEELLRSCAPGTVAQAGPHVFVEVADNGSGMDTATVQRMFEPFFSTKFTGRGLGLAAAMGIMRAHRGAIRVASQPGVGTTITLFFPVRETRTRAADHDLAWRGHGDVLVVDDEGSVRAVTSSLLRRRGFAVTEAADGVDGVERFTVDPSRWRLVLLDLTMPRMSGGQAMEAMRALRPDVPVLLMSGYSDTTLPVASEASAFLQKPFSAVQLIEAVRRLLE